VNEADKEKTALCRRRLVLMGFGNVARALKEAAGRYDQIVGTTRSAERIEAIEAQGIESYLLSSERGQSVTELCEGADLLVSFPPARPSDEDLSKLVKSARRIVYISSTGVYGRVSGKIDESSPVDAAFPGAADRLYAEDVWRAQGAIVLRAPGLYGPATGLHIRLRDRTYRLPGDGKNHISRIHLADLAQIVLAALDRSAAGSVYVVGDLHPAPQIEVVEWLCRKMQLPLPPAVPLAEVSATLRGNRQVIADKVLHDLDLTLLFPSYKEGFSQCLKAESAR
jgi:nucleoside-diphosphate-sugar epimerase